MASLPPLDDPVRLAVVLVAILVVARILGTITARLGATRVVGELATGFVLGPSLVGRALPGAGDVVAAAAASPLLADLSTLGLVFLLTLAGLETDVALVRAHLRDVVVVGTGGLVGPFVLGVALALVLPAALLTPTVSRTAFALFFATSLSISAIPVIVRILVDLDAAAGSFGQRLVATAMYTDVVGWLLLGVVIGLVRVGRVDPVATGRVALVLLAVALVPVVVGPRLVRAVLARLPATRRRESHLAVLAAVAVGVSAGGYALGVEPAIGAFVAGLVLARAEVAPAARATFERLTLRVFAPIFFGVAGLAADLGLLVDPTVAAVAAVTLVVATVGKVGGAGLAARWLGYDRAEAVGLGVGLNARGAIEVVIATVGLELGVLSPALYTVVLVVAVVTTAATPPLLRRALRGIEGAVDAPARSASG